MYKKILAWAVIIVGIVLFIIWKFRKVSNLDLCPVGSFSATGQQPCTPCPTGQTTMVTGSTECTTVSTECPIGSFSKTGQQPCTPCEFGFTTRMAGSAVCIKKTGPCGLDAYSTTGKEPCMPCQPGTYTERLSSNACKPAPTPAPQTPCPVGQYSSNGRGPSCKPCGPGLTTLAAGSMFCTTIGA